MNEIIKDNENVNKSKDKSKTDSELSLNTSKEVNIFESPGGEELNTLKNEFRDLILNDDSITPE